MSKSVVSAYNSTSTPLESGETFTGTGEECLYYNVIGINIIASHISATSGFQIQFSSNNSDWDIIHSFTIPAATGKFFNFPAEAQYFRIIYTNGTTLQTYFRLQTILHLEQTKESTLRLSNDIDGETAAQLSRSIVSGKRPDGTYTNVNLSSDGYFEIVEREGFHLSVARGRIPGMSLVDKFGYNPHVGTTSEDIWVHGGIITYPAVADIASIVSNSIEDDANKDPAGIGAYTVNIEGLDQNYAEISETVTLDGTTPVSTINSYIRINAFIILTAGSGGENAGTITVSIGGNVQREIAPGRNRANATHYTIPAGKTGYLHATYFETGKNSDVECTLLHRPFGGVFTTIRVINIYQNIFIGDDEYFRKFTEKTDVTMRGSTSTGTQPVSAGLKLVLVDN